MALTTRDRERYCRQLQLPGMGESTQKLLAHSHVLVVGCGGLGSPILYYLAAAGVGKITLIDHDTVSLSNLQRQILYQEEDIGNPKAEIAAIRLKALNQTIQLTPIVGRFTADLYQDLPSSIRLVIDGCDNLATRYEMDSFARQRCIPYLYGAVEGMTAQYALLTPHKGLGYSELFGAYSKEKDQGNVPVLGSVVGVVGCMMGTMALQYLAGQPSQLAGKLVILDASNMNLETFDLT